MTHDFRLENVRIVHSGKLKILFYRERLACGFLFLINTKRVGRENEKHRHFIQRRWLRWPMTTRPRTVLRGTPSGDDSAPSTGYHLPAYCFAVFGRYQVT